MAVTFTSLKAAIKKVNDNIERNNELAKYAITVEFTDDNEQFIPFKSGALKSSGLRNSKANFKQGIAKWSTPYAKQQYDYNRTKSRWAIKTWDKNEKKYLQMYTKVQEDNIFK